MAKTKVFTLTVQNQPGAVAGIAKALGSAKVNILALLGTAKGQPVQSTLWRKTPSEIPIKRRTHLWPGFVTSGIATKTLVVGNMRQRMLT